MVEEVNQSEYQKNTENQSIADYLNSFQDLFISSAEDKSIIKILNIDELSDNYKNIEDDINKCISECSKDDYFTLRTNLGFFYRKLLVCFNDNSFSVEFTEEDRNNEIKTNLINVKARIELLKNMNNLTV